MQPDASHNQPAPQVPLASAAPSPQPPTPRLTGAAPNSKLQINAQARQLMVQYQQNPYALAGAFQQLKSQYLADQFHIKPNSAED